MCQNTKNMGLFGAIVASAAAAAVVVAQIDPAFKATLVVYHETPAQYQDLGLQNQDTGDLGGDAYFVLRSFSLPVECKSKKSVSHFDCANPEENGTVTNVVSMNVVDVDDRYGPYGSCNLNKKTGKYACICSKGKPCTGEVGQVAVSTREIAPGWGGENWQWWRVNLAKKMQGNWYSTVAAGQCTTPSAAAVMPRLSSDATATSSTASPARGNEAPRPPCYWQLRQKVRTIAAPCLLDRVRDAVIAHNRTCFSTCPQPTNISTTCFVECFMANVLGPDGGTRIITPSEGIPVSIIQSAWKGAFANVTAGGCPDTARH